MQFKVKIAHVGDPDHAWWEEYNKDTNDPKQWAETTVKTFNETLRPGEKPRMVIEVVVAPNHHRLSHDWEKTSLVTEIGFFDNYKCKRCGITGKRYGFSEFVIPPKKDRWCKE